MPQECLSGFIPHGMSGVVTEFRAKTFMVMVWWTKAVGSLSQACKLSQCSVCFQTKIIQIVVILLY